MPMYDYACRGCGHRFEALVLPRSPATECPVCKKTDLEQLISLCSISSDTMREANLNGAHKKAAGQRNEMQRDEHKHLHQHFED